MRSDSSALDIQTNQAYNHLGQKVHGAYHNSYMKILFGDDGKLDKSNPICVPHWLKRHVQWMPTCFTSQKVGVEMCHLMPIDLDYLGTQERWKKSQKLDHLKIKRLIKKELPDIYKGFFLATLISTGEQGLCLLLKIAPFDIDKKTNKTTNDAFLHDQKLLINFFRKRGINADFGAMGVKRQCMNYHNEKLRLYYNHAIHAKVDKEYQEQCKLFKATTARQRAAKKWSGKKLSPLARIRKAVEESDSNPTRIPKKVDIANLHYNKQTQKQIAELLDFLKLNKVGRTTHKLTFTDLCNWTDMSEYKVTQLVKNKANTSHYLVFNKLANGSYEMVCELSKHLVALIDSLCSPAVSEETQKNPSQGISYSLAHLEPEAVQPGVRHPYFSALVLLLKIKGHTEQHTLSIMREISPRVKDSKNARYVKNKVRSFYKRKIDMIGIKPCISLPTWLQAVISGLDLEHMTKPRPLIEDRTFQDFSVVDKCQVKNTFSIDGKVNSETTLRSDIIEQFTGGSIEPHQQARSSFQNLVKNTSISEFLLQPSSKIPNLKLLKTQFSSGSMDRCIHEAEAQPRPALNFHLEKENLNYSSKKVAAQAAKTPILKPVKVSVDGYFVYAGNYYSTPRFTPKFCDIRVLGDGVIQIESKKKVLAKYLVKSGKGEWITQPDHEQQANYKGLQWAAGAAAKERGCDERALYADLIKGNMEERSKKLRRLWRSKCVTLLDEFESYKGYHKQDVPDNLQVAGTLRNLGMTKSLLKPARGYVDSWIKLFRQPSCYGKGVDGLTCFISDLVEENPAMIKKPLKFWDEQITRRMG